VASIGCNVRQTLPFADGDGTVRVFRQAVALDEVSFGESMGLSILTFSLVVLQAPPNSLQEQS
jgi:hypothetical protein